MAIINNMMKKLDTDVSNLKEGLHPENLHTGMIKSSKKQLTWLHHGCKTRSKLNKILFLL